MTKANFFEKQTALTAAKTKIFEEYITGYLPKLLLSFGECLVADLFCGPGKNGKNNGSPLILIDRINYILTSPILQQKSNLKIHILFNDQEQENINNLVEELSKTCYDKTVINIIVRNEKYEDLLPELISTPEKHRIPKFYFLDPFTYSNVKMHDLQQLMSFSYTEVLLFIPVFHTYRFASTNFKKEHQTRNFIEEFTVDGIADYPDIHAFMSSIKSKLIQQIKDPNKKRKPYVRYILIDGGTSKNSLFLITGNQRGMLFMNKIAFKITDDGSCVKVNDIYQNTLFPTNENTLFYSLFKKKLIQFVEIERKVTNFQIIDYTIREGFLPKDARCILKELIKSEKVSIFTKDNGLINDSRKWAISDIPKVETIIKWICYEKN